MTSAAVCPCAAQCILFCTVAKNCCDGSASGVVVHARRVDIQHLLVEPPLRRPDVPDALQQFVEVILLPLARRVLQPLVVHREPLHDVFPQPLRGPDAELRAAQRSHPVAHGDDDIQVVDVRLAYSSPSASVSKDSVTIRTVAVRAIRPRRRCSSDVQADVLLRGLEQLRHLLLRQPDAFRSRSRHCTRVRPSSVW